MIDLYTNIKKERIAQGMSQEELAHKVGYADKGMISRIENGKVDLPQSKIKEFADVLGVTPGYLMGWKEYAIDNDKQPYINNPGPNPFIGMTSKQFPGKMQQTANEIPLSPEARDFIETYQNAPEEVKQAIRALLKYSK